MTGPQPGRAGLVVMPFPDGRRTVVVVAGDADLSTALSLHDQVIGSLGYGARSLLLDLSDLDVCDLHGVDALSAAMRQAEARGITVSLRGQSPRLVELLQAHPHRP